MGLSHKDLIFKAIRLTSPNNCLTQPGGPGSYRLGENLDDEDLDGEDLGGEDLGGEACALGFLIPLQPSADIINQVICKQESSSKL